MENNKPEENLSDNHEKSKSNINRTSESTDPLNVESSDENKEKNTNIDLIALEKQLTECKKQKTPIKLPTELEPVASGHITENVGDDSTKRYQDIVCECEPSVAGAAVPTVCSFNKTASVLNRNSGTSAANPPASTKTASNISNFPDKSSEELLNIEGPSNETMRLSNPSESNKETPSDVVVEDSTSHQDTKKCISAKIEEKRSITKKMSSIRYMEKTNSNSCTKRPSLIPKLNRPSSTQYHRSTPARHDVYAKSTFIHQDLSLPKLAKIPLRITNRKNSEPNTVPTKTPFKHDRKNLTASTSSQDKNEEMLPKKNSSAEEEIISKVKFSNEVTVRKESYSIEDLHENISHVEELAVELSSMSSHMAMKLLQNTNEIKKIVSHLIGRKSIIAIDASTQIKDHSEEDFKWECVPKVFEDSSTQSVGNDEISARKNLTSKLSKPNNKVFIKFIQSKDKNEKKSKENDRNASETLSSETLATDGTDTEEATNKNNKVQNSDSMDGVFIPTYEPPVNMEEEEESNGLDITIRFPEFSQLVSEEPESHLSVRMSDISADALKRLKRCPKDFTLRMDFVQGKIHFQSGKAPANNFSIGPDLKVIEDALDEKKSAIIDIKPSTECRFNSQQISIENVKERTSHKSLKSTDSELFNVVNLPFIYTHSSVNPVTKSCISFRNDNFLSMAYVARQFFKSMPQIPSLSNILENKVMENCARIALSTSEKRRKTRASPKKIFPSSTAI